MTDRITPPAWDEWDPNMLINVADMKYYYENFTEVVDDKTKSNDLAIQTLDGRVTKIEQEQPVGPGGTGAYLNLGGTPDRYPTAEEMNTSGGATGFIVMARQDGIYFYNPVSKLLIKPKKGGGTIAVHGQLPMIYDNSHKIQYNGRLGKSGIYTAKSDQVGLTSWTSYETCKILVVATEDEEFHTAMGPDGFASRIFRAGSANATWSHFTGGGGGTGGVDPAIIDEINSRLDALEQYDHTFKITDLSDVILDPVLDANGLLYMDEQGKIRGGSTNPLLSMGYTHTHTNGVGAPPVIAINNVGANVVASNNIIMLTATSTKTVTLPSVVRYNSFKPTTTQVREGRTTFIVNMSDVEQTVALSPGGRFYIEGSMDSTNGIVPPKTVFVYNPAMIDNGSGAIMECWIYMGNYPLRATDLSNVLLSIQDLQNQVNGYSDAIDTIVEGFEDMSVGDVLTSYNGLGCRPIASSNDITAATIAGAPFAVGQGSGTGKKFTLPDIASVATVKLPASTVREGRITILSNFSTVPRTVHLSGGCKFNLTGTSVTTTQTMPAKTTWILSPGIYGNGDKIWTYIGSMFGDNMGSGIVNAGMRVTNKNMTTNGIFTSSEISQANVAASRTVALTGSTARYCRMPEILSHTTSGTITDTQVRQGFVITIGNFSTANLFLAPVSGQKWYIGGVETTGDRMLDPGVMETYMANIQSSTQKWVLIGRSMKDGSPVGMGDMNFSANSITDTTLHSSANVQASVSGLYSVIVKNTLASDANSLVWLPDIVPATQVPTSGQVRVGRTTTVIATGEVGTVVRYTAGKAILLPDGTAKDNYELPVGHVMVLKPEATQWRLVSMHLIEAPEVVTPTFTSLPDTPSGYQPGKLVGYNLAGDALIPVDPTERFRQLTDTPSDYGGHARKYLAVKPSEDGIDFVTGPDVSGLTADVNNLHNDMIAVNNNITVHGNRITTLESKTTSINTLLYNPLIGSGNYTQANAAEYNPCILRATTARTLALPEIVAANVTPTSIQSCIGRSLQVCNHSATVNLTINAATGRLIRYPNATTGTSHVLAAGACMELIALSTGGVNYWQVMRQWTV